MGPVADGISPRASARSTTCAEVVSRKAWNSECLSGPRVLAMSGDRVNALQSLSIFAAQRGTTWISLGLPDGPGPPPGPSGQPAVRRSSRVVKPRVPR